MKKDDEEKERGEGLDISELIGGSLNLFGVKIDLGKLLSSAESAGELGSKLEGLREGLKRAGGRETISDEEWKAGRMSVGGHIRTTGILGDTEYEIGVKERKTYGKAAKPREPQEPEVREPFVDIFYEKEDGEYARVVAELPGVDSKDIEISTAGKKLTISAHNPTHRYRKEIELDYPVKDEFETTYRNGILEIKVAKQTGG